VSVNGFDSTDDYDEVTAASSSGGQTSLKWSDPLGASCNDYDLFILDSTLSNTLEYSANDQTCTQDPYEWVSAPAAGEVIVVTLWNGSTRALHIDTERGELAINTSGATYGHNAAASALTVAATPAQTSIFTDGGQAPESYSSDGPRKIFYDPDGTAITPGNFLFGTSGGTTLAKVDFTAADCGQSAVPNFNPFCGTSAAAPTAAAIAALIGSVNSSLTPSQVVSTMRNTALAAQSGYNTPTVGAGIVMANLPPPSLTSPSNGSTNQTTTPLFSWKAVTGASSYRILIATSASALPRDAWVDTCSCVFDDTPSANSDTPGAGVLSAGKTYYWEVHARGPSQYGTWSSVYSFTTSTGGPSIAISSVSPGSIAIVKGGSAQSVTVSLTRNSFSGSVTLAATNLPSGVTPTYTQPGTGNSGSISLKASSSATLVSGQTITITASGSGVTSVTSTFSLTVNPPSIAISSVNPASVTIYQGGSAQVVSVGLTRNAYSGSVTLTATNLPSGVTPTYTQPGTGSSGSISLKASSSATLVTNQTITVTASGSGVTSVTSTFSLTVNPPSIAISSVSPTSVTLYRAGSAQKVTVDITRTSFTGSVSLAATNLPSGVTASYTQPGTGNSGTISLTASSSATLVAGQTITITASGSGVTSVTSTFNLTVNTPSIAISKVSPTSITLARGGSAQSVTVTLTRNGFTSGVSLAVSTLPTGVTATITQPGTGTSGTISLKASSSATVVSGQTITIKASGSGVTSVTATFSLTT
jgi:hypothetical protein